MKEIQFREDSIWECRQLSGGTMRAVGQKLAKMTKTGTELGNAESWCMMIEVAMDARGENALPHDGWSETPNPKDVAFWTAVRQTFHWNSSEELLQSASVKMAQLRRNVASPMSVSIPFVSTRLSWGDIYVQGEIRVCLEGEFHDCNTAGAIITAVYAVMDALQADGAQHGYMRGPVVTTLKEVDFPVWYQFDDDHERFKHL